MSDPHACPTREGCCDRWRRPCPYHEGWDDAMDSPHVRRLEAVYEMVHNAVQHDDHCHCTACLVARCAAITVSGRAETIGDT